MPTQLHLWLAVASVLILVLAGLEAAQRAWRRAPPGQFASRFEGLTLLAVGIAAGGGLGLLVGGARPHEMLHLVYAVIAFAALPIAAGLARQASARTRGLASLAGSLIALVVVARLFGTG
jgi:hypothetical protein